MGSPEEPRPAPPRAQADPPAQIEITVMDVDGRTLARALRTGARLELEAGADERAADLLRQLPPPRPRRRPSC